MKEFVIGFISDEGEVPEWFNGSASETVWHKTHRGFESRPPRTLRRLFDYATMLDVAMGGVGV